MSQDRRAAFRRSQWTVLFATMFCYLFYYTGRQTAGFAIPGIHDELGLSFTTLGWFSTALLWSYAIGQAINGNLGDIFGGRRMMSGGAVLSMMFNWIVSFGSSAVSLFVPWAANGLAQSMGWAPGSRVLSNWWSRRERGMVYGFYVFAAGMSSVLAFVTSLVVLDVFHLGWRWIFRLPVLLLFVGGLTYYFVVRDRPEERGFERLEDTGGPEADSPISADTTSDETAWQRYVAALSNWRFLAASLAIGFQSTARYGLLIWVPVYFLGADWKTADATRWISIVLPVGMAFGALASGNLSDRFFGGNRSRPMALFLGLAAVSAMSMYFLPRGHAASLVVLFLCGFFVYGPQSLFWSLCPDLLGKHRTGTGTGVMNFFAYLFAGLGEPFMGWMIEANDDLALVFPLVAMACLVGAVIALAIRR